MPEIPEELDVFYLPHVHMKKLVQDIEHQVCLPAHVHPKAAPIRADDRLMTMAFLHAAIVCQLQ